MLLDIFLSAVALLLVLEGILPFLSPETWRKTVKAIAAQSDKSLRITGLVMMLAGLVILYILHN